MKKNKAKISGYPVDSSGDLKIQLPFDPEIYPIARVVNC